MSNAAKSVSQFGKFADLLMMVAVMAVGVAGFFLLWSLYDPPKKEEASPVARIWFPISPV